MKISLVNLGCKVNDYELRALKTALEEMGHEAEEGLEAADAYVLNTCAVTGEAERKSRQHIGKIKNKNPEAVIVVMGCASEKDRQAFLDKGISFAAGTSDRSKVIEFFSLLNEKNITDYNGTEASEDRESKNDFHIPAAADKLSGGKTRRYIKIQDGCDSFCSYCVIPSLRGRSRSRDIDGVLSEIGRGESGEVVLIGINLSEYGKDIGVSLNRLMEAVGDRYESLRLRLGSLEARVIDRSFLDAVKGLKRFCPHFHLSLQSGDDGVLSDMNRRYTADCFLERVELIREYYPDAAITTDIIAGFPTESAEAFGNTLSFAKSAAFADIHVFPYSARTGTAAATLKTAVPDAVIKERVKKLIGLKRELKSAYISRFIGKSLSVLFETYWDGEYSGYSENYIRIYTEARLECGTVSRIKIEGLYKDGAKGYVNADL